MTDDFDVEMMRRNWSCRSWARKRRRRTRTRRTRRRRRKRNEEAAATKPFPTIFKISKISFQSFKILLVKS